MLSSAHQITKNRIIDKRRHRNFLHIFVIALGPTGLSRGAPVVYNTYSSLISCVKGNNLRDKTRNEKQNNPGESWVSVMSL